MNYLTKLHVDTYFKERPKWCGDSEWCDFCGTDMERKECYREIKDHDKRGLYVSGTELFGTAYTGHYALISSFLQKFLPKFKKEFYEMKKHMIENYRKHTKDDSFEVYAVHCKNCKMMAFHVVIEHTPCCPAFAQYIIEDNSTGFPILFNKETMNFILENLDTINIKFDEIENTFIDEIDIPLGDYLKEIYSQKKPKKKS